MFVYKWPGDKENDTGVVVQHSSCHVRGEGPPALGAPGLDTHSLRSLGGGGGPMGP